MSHREHLPSIRDHEVFGPALDGRHTADGHVLPTTELLVRGSRSAQDTGPMQAVQYGQGGYAHGPHPVVAALALYHAPPYSSPGSNSHHSSVSTISSHANSSATSLVGDYTDATDDLSSDDNPTHRGRTRPANAVKKVKEKKNRADLGSLMQRLQEICVCLCGSVHGSEQSAGNAKSSGLKKRKIDILQATIALLSQISDPIVRAAAEEGTSEELQARFQRMQTWYLEQPEKHMDPTYRTLMYVPGPRCERGTNGNCITHDEPQWSKCQSAHSEEAFKKNKEAHLRDCVPGTRKRRME